MNVCSECFSDKELKGFIKSQNIISDCSFCESKRVPTIPIIELKDFFQELIDNFQLSSMGESLINRVQGNWSLFRNHEIASNILNYLIPELSTIIVSSDSIVDYTEDIIENINYWSRLKNELKWEKRFLVDINYLTDDLGWDGFFNTQYELSEDVELYRARVHHRGGLSPKAPSEMYCPEREYVSGGRANPSGIPVLYLSDSSKTVIHEVRASYLDELSVGVFHLKTGYSSIRIVDFTEDTSIFQPNNVKETIKGKLLRERISQDLSKPMRRYDSEIEYIPTQFICEFIKVFTGAKGIKFRSSLDPRGKNLVIFDKELMECKDVKLVQVTKVNMNSTEI